MKEKNTGKKRNKPTGAVQKLFQQDLEHLEKIKKQAPEGHWESKPLQTLADPWRTVLEVARPGTTVIAISDASPKWWEQGRGWLEANVAAIEKGVEFIRIFIVDDEKDLGPHGTLSKEFLEVMARVAQAGIQVNIVKASNLPSGVRRDLLLVNVKVPNAADPVNTEKLILTESDSIAGITVFDIDRVRPTQAIVSERAEEVAENVDAATKIYRASIRFPHPQWYPAGLNWLDAYYDEGYKKISAALRDPITKKEIEFLAKVLNLEKNSSFRILDHGCGFGRIMTPLLEKFPNLGMVGLDQSKSYIDELNKNLTKQNLAGRGRAFVGDYERLNEFLPIIGQFDFVISLLSSFGHYLLSDKNSQEELFKRELEAIKNALKPGGKLLLDLNNISDIQKLSGKTVLVKDIERFERFFKEADLSTRLAQFVLIGKSKSRWNHALARLVLFKKDYLTNLLESVGFKVVDIFGDVVLENGRPIPYNEENSPRMVILAEKKS